MADGIEVGRLSVGVELDLSTLHRQVKNDLRAAAAEAGRDAGRALATSLSRAVKDARLDLGGATSKLGRSARSAGNKAGQEVADALERAYQNRMGRARLDLRSGAIDQASFDKRAREAAEIFNRGLLREIGRLRAGGVLSAARLNELTQQFKEAGRRAGEEFSDGTRTGMQGSMRSLLNWVRGGVFLQIAQIAVQAGRAVIQALATPVRAALDLERSYLRLNSAAKLYGVSQEVMLELSQRGRKEMQLSAGAANELAIQAARIAGRAGEAARAQELWNAALDLAAANGLDAAQAALALEQSFRGVDEGLNRLGLADPSTLYKEWAAQIGTTADKLTDAQKQQAIMNAIVDAGSAVQGEYQRQLQGNLGQLSAWQNAVRTAREEIGDALLPIIVTLTNKLEGPMAAAVRTVTRLLEGMMSPLERLARRMEEMGAASELILPLTLQDRANSIREEIRGLQDEIDELTAPRVTATEIQANPLAGLSAAQLRQTRQELARRQAEDAAEGRTEFATVLADRIALIDRLLAKQAELEAKNRELTATETALGDAIERRDQRMELNAVEAEIERITRLGGEYNELKGQLDALKRRREELRALLEPPKAEGGPSMPTGPELTDAQIREIESARKALEERVRAFEAMRPLRDITGGQPEIPRELEAQLQRILEIDTEIQAIEEEIRAARGQAPAAIQQVVASLQQERSVLQERVQAIRDQWANLPQVQAQLSRVLTTTQEIARTAVNMGDEGWQTITSAVDGVTRALRESAEAEEELQRARLAGDPERVARALRRQADAQRAVERATARAMRIYEAGADAGVISQERLNELIQEMIDLLEAAGIEIEGVTEKQRDWGELARNIESLGRGVLSVADAMGVLDDRSRRTLQGLIDVGSAIAQIAQNPANIAAWAQGIGGAVGIIKSLFGGSAEDRARVYELREAMRSLTDALHALRTAVLSEISLAEKQRIETAGDNFLRRFGPIIDQAQRLGFGGTPATITGLTQADFDFLRDLEELTGIDFFDERAGTIIADAFEAAWEAFQRMDVAGFAKDLTGRLDAIDYAARIAGDALGGAADQMDLFLDTVRDFSPEFATQFERILTEQGMDAARAWLQQQAVLFAEGGAEALGAWARNLTPGEIQRIIDEGLERTAPGGVTGGEPGSTRLGVSITEVQASLMLAELTTQTYHLAGIHQLLRGGLAPPPSMLAIAPPSPAALGLTSTRPAAVNNDFRGVTFEVHFDGEAPSLSTPSQWEAAGAAFGRGFGARLADIAAGAGIDRARIDIRRAG